MNIQKLKENYGDVLWAGKRRRLGLPLSFTTYVITSKKLYTARGLFNLTEDNLDLYKVTDYSLKQPWYHRIFGCGTIEIASRDTDTPLKLFIAVKDPRGVTRILEDAVENERSKYAVRGRDMFGAAAHEPENEHEHNIDGHF